MHGVTIPDGVRQYVSMQKDELISPAELAAWLSIPVGTIYRWNYLGTGPQALRLGKHVRYRHSEVETWLTAQARGRAS